MISYLVRRSAASVANGTNVSLRLNAIIETSTDAKNIGLNILVNGIPSDFSAINSLPALSVDIPSRVDNSDDIGTVIITTSGSL